MLDAMIHAIRTALGVDIDPHDLNGAQMALRAAVIYLGGLVIVRIAKKRFMGGHSAFDGVLAIILGSVLSRAINGSAPFFETVAAALTLVLVHRVIGLASYHSHALGDLVKGRESELVRDGKILEAEMRAHHITRHDLEEAMHLHGGFTDIGQLEAAHLERSGDISTIRRREPRVVEVAVAPGTQTVRIQLE